MSNLFRPQGVIFRKILVILIFLSLIPVAFSAFLTISTYQGFLVSLGGESVFANPEAAQLKQNILMQIFLILFLLVILIVFASSLVAYGITRPLSSLVKGVKQVSVGNYNIRFRIKSKDELGELAMAFNEMVLRLKEQREREEFVGKMKTEFISIAAHQLRTPLSSVKWILKMTLNGDVGKISTKQHDFLSKGYTANERMIHLVNDLLNVSRVEEGKFGLKVSMYDLDKVIRGVVDSFEQQLSVRNVKLEYVPSPTPLFFKFDRERIDMVLSNLMDNAIRYTPVGGKVTVSVEEREGFLGVTIKDTGAGVPEDQKDRVFSKFFRGNNVVRMQTEGTGLGLYLCKNIVEKHGGRIWFESTEGKGSSFYFTLPKNK
ncbi:HAMP domain-containing histidine kinase [Patescibacteria group bacterium]|nr:HAMP domain-containing histidine kinase [Patescibacteria group bacterium]MBU2633318.1 HAMP domain-containing histidine kinase [Patescibacteria group bacterium]